jgi:DNA-binding transcriptional ArsR family regulator
MSLHGPLAALAPPRRFALMVLLLSGLDRSVSQLAEAVGLSQSCTTRHLQALERAGLVKGFRDGKRVVFRPEPRDAAAREVLASLAREGASPFASGRLRRSRPGGAPRGRAGARAASEPARGPTRKRRRAAPATAVASDRPSQRPIARVERARRSFAAAIPIASSNELEPIAEAATDTAAGPRAKGARPGRAESGASRAGGESGNSSPPAPEPAWRRSDIEDFLL